MDNYVLHVVVGICNLAVGFGAGWVFQNLRRSESSPPVDSSEIDCQALQNLLDEVEFSAFDQVRSWLALHRSLMHSEKLAPLEPHICSNRFYALLLASHRNQLKQLDPRSRVLPRRFLQQLEANRQSVDRLTDELGEENTHFPEIDAAKLLSRLEQLEAANQTLCKQLAEARTTIARQSAELEFTRANGSEDYLTRLPNRRAFEQRFAELCTQYERHGTPFSLLLVDLDDFKNINERYGYEAGDAVLTVSAHVLSDNCRPGDHLSRFGGDEFALLMPEADADATRLLAERIRGRIEAAAVTHQGQRIQFTCRVGIARTEAEHRPETLVSWAEQFLEAPRESGENRVSRLPLTGSVADTAEKPATLLPVS